ncbi:MAG: hypothetical protein M1812_004422 [Candelaria pacifica]|nr:MAG: hypothetical protein M1812_004422 [Candelaria pacifica]
MAEADSAAGAEHIEGGESQTPDLLETPERPRALIAPATDNKRKASREFPFGSSRQDTCKVPKPNAPSPMGVQENGTDPGTDFHVQPYDNLLREIIIQPDRLVIHVNGIHPQHVRLRRGRPGRGTLGTLKQDTYLLTQMADIMLQMAGCRFDKIGGV